MSLLSYLFNPENLIQTVGLAGLILIIFAESGLFFGFFLPGDSLLFTAGLFASQGYFSLSLLVIGSSIAAILGDSVGYAFGKKVGPRLFSRQDSFFFHQKHAERARVFYEKHGKKTIILARFVPIVRTFAPIIAGIGGMHYKTFISYNIIGGIAWAGGISLAGYFLGTLFPHAQDYLHIIVIVIIVASLIPILVEYIREKKKQNTQAL